MVKASIQTCDKSRQQSTVPPANLTACSICTRAVYDGLSGRPQTASTAEDRRRFPRTRHSRHPRPRFVHTSSKASIPSCFLPMACQRDRLAMGHNPVDPDGCWIVPVGNKLVGLFRIPKPANAWRFRSPETLDGDHNTPTSEQMVLL